MYNGLYQIYCIKPEERIQQRVYTICYTARVLCGCTPLIALGVSCINKYRGHVAVKRIGIKKKYYHLGET